MSGEKFRHVLRHAVLCGLLSVCFYQLWGIYQDWETNPITTFTLEVQKHDVPFPSITVCPEGFSLWSGVREYLNDFEFKDEYKARLNAAYREFVRHKFKIAQFTDHENSIDDCFGDSEEIVSKSR